MFEKSDVVYGRVRYENGVLTVTNNLEEQSDGQRDEVPSSVPEELIL